MYDWFSLNHIIIYIIIDVRVENLIKKKEAHVMEYCMTNHQLIGFLAVQNPLKYYTDYYVGI